MKKIVLCLLLVFSFFGNTVNINAASASSSLTGPKTVTVGSKITVTAKVSGKKLYIINGNISSSNSSVLSGSGSLYKKADLMENSNGFSSVSKSVTFTAKSVGTATISFSDGGIGLTVDDDPVSFSTKKLTINVVAKSSGNNTSSGNTGSSGNNTSSGNAGSSGNNTSSGNTGTTQKPVVDTKSKDNNLSSLTVSEGTLDPKFESSKTKYNVDLPGTSKEVTISAKAKDAKAKISGIGKKTLKVGENSFKVICTAENGSQKTYTVVFHVDEAPLVYTKLGEKNLGVVRVLDDVKAPKNFKETTIKLDGQDIIGYKNDQLNMAVAYLVDESGNKDFYIIENEKVVSQFIKITISSREYYVVNTSKVLNEVSQLKQSKIKIGDIELDGWLFNDEEKTNYSIVYLMNSDGKANLYSYESTEGTLQLYTPIVTNDDSLNTMTYVFMGTTGVFAMTSIVGFVMYFRFKKKSISAIKDYYEK